MSRLHLDLETRSTITELGKTGVYIYATHPDTDVWCACYALDDGPVQTWRPEEPVPQDLSDALSDPSVTVVAHNAGFEWHLVNFLLAPRYGWPELPIERMDDTAARAAVQSLPRDLARAAPAAGLDVEKDAEGRRLMLQMARPRRYDEDGNPVWWDVPEKRERLEAYCRKDVEVERELDDVLQPLSKRERKVWIHDQKINHRGVQVDLNLVERLDEVLQHALADYGRELDELTRGYVDAVSQVEPMKYWLEAQLDEEVASLDKPAVARLLARDDLSGHVRRVIEIRRDAAKSSTAKLRAFKMRTDDTGRMRENLMYHGAGTGRWSGSGVQLQNLPRPELSQAEIEQVVRLVTNTRLTVAQKAAAIEWIYGPVPTVVSSCLRACITAAPNYKLIVADFNNIEGRCNAWAAGQDDKVELFREGGPIYERMAAEIYDIPVASVTKDSKERHLGKTAELGCGYGMGAPKFLTTCQDQGIDVGKDMAETAVATFREVNDKIVRLWHGLERAAKSAMEVPGSVTEYNGIRFNLAADGSYLVMVLPNGRRLWYARPKLEDTETPWGAPTTQITYMGIDQYTRQWKRISTYGGKLTENCLTGDTEVLTSEGWKPIAAIRLEDRIWDGVEWVRHEGLIDQGRQPTVELSGVRLTADHEVLTDEGWKAASQVEGHDRLSCWLPDGERVRRERRQEIAVEMPLRLRGRENATGRRAYQDEEARGRGVLRLQAIPDGFSAEDDSRHVQASSVRGLEEHAGSLPAPLALCLEELRRAWDHGMRALAVFRGVLGGHGALVPAGALAGAYQQQRPVLAGQLPVGDQRGADAQPTPKPSYRHAPRAHDSGRSGKRVRDREDYAALPDTARHHRPGTARPTGRTEQVYDIRNCGPRRRFVVRPSGGGQPFIAHNCIQAIARDLLATAMYRAEHALGMPVVLTVHDEIVCEVPEDSGLGLDDLIGAMEQVPKWAAGCPVKAEGYEGFRFRK